MFGLGAGELLIVLIVVLLIFGANQLPKLARSLGRAQKEFKSGLDEGADAGEDEKPKKQEETKGE